MVSQKFVTKFPINATECRVDELVNCYSRLSMGGIAPSAVKTKKKINGKTHWGYRYPWIDGADLELLDPMNIDFSQLGMFLGKIHEALEPVTVSKQYKLRPSDAKQCADDILKSSMLSRGYRFTETVALKRSRLDALIPENLASILDNGMKQTIHGDVCPANIIQSASGWKIIDLDRAICSNPLYEVVRAVVLTKDFKLDLLDDKELTQTLAAYFSVRKNIEMEAEDAIRLFYLVQLGDFYGLDHSLTPGSRLSIFAEKRCEFFHRLDACFWPLIG